MAMDVKLYNVTDENNKLNKTLKNEVSFTGTLKNETDIINPEIILRVSNEVITSVTNPIMKKNYLYLPLFQRYYFITDITVIQSELIRIKTHIDVLMSYNSGIKSMKGIVDRQENYYNLYMNDMELRKMSYSLIQHKAFPGHFNGGDYNFFLITAGG